MIRVFTQDNFQTGAVDVYAIVRDSDRGPGRLLVLEPGPGDVASREAEGWYEHKLDEAQAAFGAVTLSLPVDVVRPLVEALNRSGLPPRRTDDDTTELADCRKTRDRLLGMVERIVDSDLAREAARG